MSGASSDFSQVVRSGLVVFQIFFNLFIFANEIIRYFFLPAYLAGASVVPSRCVPECRPENGTECDPFPADFAWILREHAVSDNESDKTRGSENNFPVVLSEESHEHEEE
mmetsp:Transcript_16565/g.40800  ORF Transcript_16565/g.40800 Transcript_16565/m.40800 type:complete len:110 (-) Transcript_16565:564-893(-)